ncbi:MAG: glycosyltransferase family 4 protein [Chthoniobacteraceae bacterium]
MPATFAYLFERFPSFVQTFVYREAAEMVRQGAEPWLVSIRRPDDELSEPLDAPVFYLPEEKALRDEVDARRAARKVPWRARRAIPRHRNEADSQRMFEAIWLEPELKARGVRHVHAHFGGMAARTAWWLRKLFGFTYSYTGHANDIFCETEYPVSNAELARRARFVVTETDYARGWMERRHPFAKGKVFRVFNGIEPAGFPPREAESEVPRIVSVGRYVEKKGFDVLIEACAKLRRRGVAFTCEIIGGGPMHEALARMIELRELEDFVTLVGPRTQPEVRRALAGAQLFVLACRQDSEGGSDNLPTVIAEAMFAGVPCISTKIAGVPEMIADGRTGVLVPARDAFSLAAAMERLLGDRLLAAKLGANGRDFARERFTIERSVAELRRLLRERAGVGRRGWWPW